MLWYQAGLRAAPLADATISREPSSSGKNMTGVERASPDLAPIVVRTSSSWPRIFTPLRRMRPTIRFWNHPYNPPPFGSFPPRVPAVVSKLIRPPRVGLPDDHRGRGACRHPKRG